MMTNFLAYTGRITLSLFGAFLSLGAPLGWLAIRWFQGVSPAREFGENPELMLYLLFPTMIVFALVGYAGGLQWERLWEAKERLKELATRDGLTGLRNARSFWKDAGRECRRAGRHDYELHILVIDLDHFKNINDTYGHLVGDDLLKAVAKAMSEVMRDDEGPYRVGGEEFAVLLVDLPGEEAEVVAERLRKAVTSVKLPVTIDEEPDEIEVTVSIGLAGKACQNPSELQQLYGLADQALYTAKAEGRNRVCSAPAVIEQEIEKVF